MSYFDLAFNPAAPKGFVHKLNRCYRGATLFTVRAPDADGVLHVWARDEEELHEHLVNALFDLVFNYQRTGAHIKRPANPPCIFCGGATQSHGRNSAGTRVWRCTNPECRRKFVLNRMFRGGINHPTQSKKPAFAQLLLSGVTPVAAADRLGLNHHTAGNWAAQIEALNRERFAALKCPCGKPLRHRGICLSRYTPEGRQRLLAALRGRGKQAA